MLMNVTDARQHDTANYGTGMLYRGNVTATTQFGQTVSNLYDILGAVNTASDGYGHAVTQTNNTSTNYAAPPSVLNLKYEINPDYDPSLPDRQGPGDLRIAGTDFFWIPNP